MKIHLLSPGDPRQRTGGYLYNARMISELITRGHEVVVHVLDADWPLPATLPSLPQLPDGSTVLADGLLWTGLGDARARFSRCHTHVLVHCPLYRAARIPALRELELAALREATQVITTGPPTTRDLPVPSVCIVPGVDPSEHSTNTGVLQILTVASVTPLKGIDTLAHGLAQHTELPWAWRIVGSLTRDPIEAARVGRLVAELGERAQLVGEVEDLRPLYQTSGLLLQGAHYEAFGMGISEALAAGIPVVSPPAGVLETVVEPAWISFIAGDPEDCARAIRAALYRLDPLQCAARRVRQPSWETQAQRLEMALYAPTKY